MFSGDLRGSLPELQSGGQFRGGVAGVPAGTGTVQQVREVPDGRGPAGRVENEEDRVAAHNVSAERAMIRQTSEAASLVPPDFTY